MAHCVLNASKKPSGIRQECPMPLGFEMTVLAGTLALKRRQGWNVYRKRKHHIVFVFRHPWPLRRAVRLACPIYTEIAFVAGETHRPTQRPWVPENKRLCGVCVFYKHSTPNGVSAE